MTDDEIDTIWWMAGKMKPWEFRKYMRVVFAGIADTAGASPVLVRKGRTAKDDIYAVAPADTAGAKRLETTSEHIARDIREGRFPQRSEPQMIAATPAPSSDTAGAKLSASNLPEEFRIKDPADYKRTMDTQFAATPASSVADARPLNDEQIAKAWFGDEYGPGHTRAPGYVYTFIKALNESPAPSVADAAGAKPCDMGVGCDESGVCYAEANGEPDRCSKFGVSGMPPSGLTERERFIWNLGYSSGKENV